MNADCSQLSQEIWDAVIAGAGPAGSVAASLLAGRGWRTLLIEKSPWPRAKVCGGCLSAAAVGLLDQMGMRTALRGAQQLDGITWRAGQRVVSIPAAGGAAMLRSELDAALVANAMERGCEFVSGVLAKLLPGAKADYRTVELRTDAYAIKVKARVVLACDGIGGKFLAAEPWAKWRIAPGAWMGVATTFCDRPSELSSGNIHMHIGKGGYVGLVSMGNGLVHLAAALDPNVCRKRGGPRELVGSILESCGKRALENSFIQKSAVFSPSPGNPGEGRGEGSSKNEIFSNSRKALTLAFSRSAGRGGDSQKTAVSAHFHGTGLLTRQREALGGNRVLAIGDACGYVEPFTGEGIAWTIASARDAVALLAKSPNHWSTDLAERWTAQQHMEMARRQRVCRAMMPMVHHPAMAAGALFLARMVPALGKFIACQIGHPLLPHMRPAYEGIQ